VHSSSGALCSLSVTEANTAVTELALLRSLLLSLLLLLLLQKEGKTVITDYPEAVGIWSGCGSDPKIVGYGKCISDAITAAEDVPDEVDEDG
jgi:hypothetical protein